METFSCPSNPPYDDMVYRMKWVNEILQSTVDSKRTVMDFPGYYGTGDGELIGCVADDNYGDDLSETVDGNNGGDELSDTVDDEIVRNVPDSGVDGDVSDEVDGKFIENAPNHNGGDELGTDVGDQEDDKLDGNVVDNNNDDENLLKRGKSCLVNPHPKKHTDEAF